MTLTNWDCLLLKNPNLGVDVASVTTERRRAIALKIIQGLAIAGM